MEIKFEKRNFHILDSCPVDGPKKRYLKRHVREHGVSSLLESKKYSQFAVCILDELLKEGAEMDGQRKEADNSEPLQTAPLNSDADKPE